MPRLEVRTTLADIEVRGKRGNGMRNAGAENEKMSKMHFKNNKYKKRNKKKQNGDAY